MNIDWKLLSKQKNHLLHSEFVDTEAGTGILHLIDALQDAAVKMGVPKKNVFMHQPTLEQPLVKTWTVKELQAQVNTGCGKNFNFSKEETELLMRRLRVLDKSNFTPFLLTNNIARGIRTETLLKTEKQAV